ncbi:MAG: S-methyl-5-thioribose-1-phosphate isomerase [Candidatus Wallbacteria bacterium]|nr:S-methyl-5-thioribose-1-phosphate isomerase [Candidatus Wallbacteria bacterium]
MIEAIRWSREAVLVLDQLQLPRKVEWVRCVRSDEVADCIAAMKIRGAPAIGVAAAMGLALGAREPAAREAVSLADFFAVISARMAATRPTAVNLTWAIGRMQQAFAAALPRGLEAVRAALEEEALEIARQDRETCAAMGRHGATLIPRDARVLTHCNTGSLATAGSGTALAVIREAHARGRVKLVYVDETRPYLQGARLTAWELAQDGIPQRLIADSMAAFLMARGEVDFVVLGADRIAANGDVANKIGTYGLSVQARHHGVPFYVAAPLSTVDVRKATGAGIPIEERPARELTELAGIAIAPEGVGVWNPSFDVTPHQHITGIITEVGVLRPPYWQSIPEAVLKSGETSGFSTA